MLQALCHKALFGWFRFTEDVTEPMPEKCIIALAPHTSNWDFIIGNVYSRAKGFHSDFLMKKEWFFWPLGPIFRRMGGIPVFRSKHTSMTDNMAEAARRLPLFQLCITPEGTRSPNPDWKKGFYFIAQKAGIPILLYGVDYQKKLIRCTRTIVPNGDIESQMREIKLYFKDFKGRHPEKFTIGEI